jgi:transposase InsO family protein
MITHEENSDRAQHFIREAIRQQGIEESNQLTFHSDRGSDSRWRYSLSLPCDLGCNSPVTIGAA